MAYQRPARAAQRHRFLQKGGVLCREMVLVAAGVIQKHTPLIPLFHLGKTPANAVNHIDMAQPVLFQCFFQLVQIHIIPTSSGKGGRAALSFVILPFASHFTAFGTAQGVVGQNIGVKSHRQCILFPLPLDGQPDHFVQQLIKGNTAFLP